MFFFFDFCWSGLLLNFNLLFLVLLFMIFFLFSFIYFFEFYSSLNLMFFFLLFMGIYIFGVNHYFFVYLMMELLLLPLLLILLGYGSQIQKITSLYYLIFYSGFCSLPMMWVYLYSNYGGFLPFFHSMVSLLVLFFFVFGFFMKFPLYYLHFWLPLVHVESPTTLSMYLAGVVLKFGVYGFILFYFIFSYLNNFFFLFWSVLGMIFVIFMCMSSSDTKVMAAYSSVIHMSFLFFIMMYYNFFSSFSVFFMILGHGYISFLWFYFLGIFFHSIGLRLVYMTFGMMTINMLMFFFFGLIMMFNAGVPLSFSFFSEILGITSLVGSNFWVLFILFFYYFGSFFYSISFMLSSSSGKMYYFFYLSSLNFVMVIFIINFNLFMFF